MLLHMFVKSILGMLFGLCLGAILVGLAAVLAGPQWVLNGMLLGALAGSFLGTAGGFYKSIQHREWSLKTPPVMAVTRFVTKDQYP